MAIAARYFNLVREMKNAYIHRLRLVESAKPRGIKPTARLFATTVPTVRKWLCRYRQHGPSGLVEPSRARHRQPHKTPPTLEAQLVELRKTLPTFGARRLIREFDLPISHGPLVRIWCEHGLMEKRRRKYQRKQDLAPIKARWALFQQISADTQDLGDIPPLLSTGPTPALTDHPVHRTGNPQWPAGLGFRAATQCACQRGLRFSHPATPGSLWRRVQGRLSQSSR
jgi:transposase